eukprot:4928506-Pleurochrysis_carterae.AAC.1
MKLHVLGVNFHGRADKVHLFPVAPNIVGNANLTGDCILRAVQIEFAISGMPPRLHVQISTSRYYELFNLFCFPLFPQMDNAFDKKKRKLLAFFAWMVAVGWVKEVTISVMTPGHTHEDIDAPFKRIVERWKQLGHVLIREVFKTMLQVSAPHP